MRYLSVCSGVEAASVAWHDLGWTPVGFSEIEPFPSAVLAHRFPAVKNYGDMTKYKEWDLEPGTVDVLVGGTPCQSFSVAGLRKGLDDPRGNLMLVYLGLAERFRIPWLVWENVPGVLSSNGGRDFGTFLGALGQLGYRWAFRVLDAQYFGVPQRRRRVFVVAHLGDRGDPAKVLFEPESLRGDSAKGGKARQGAPRGAGKGAASGGRPGPFWNGADIADALTRTSDDQRMPDKGRMQMVVQPIAMRESGQGYWLEDTVSGTIDASMGQSGHANRVATIAFHPTQDPIASVEVTHALGTGSKGGCATAAVATEITGTLSSRATAAGGLGTDFEVAGGLQAVDVYNGTVTGDVTATLNASTGASANHSGPSVLLPTMAVRRLLPVECERLQGFPDGWTAIPWKGKAAPECPDGPRYKAMGNSMAVPVMRWIGRRLDAVARGES
jgi:DNA (cytosine-5)-methyltransferase 1